MEIGTRTGIAFTALLLAAPALHATEGGLGRPVTGTSVTANAGIVPPQPIWAVNIGEIYLDGSIGGGKEVPIAGRVSLGVDAEVSFTLATVLKVWDTGPGHWNYASSFTLPYVWTETGTTLVAGSLRTTQRDEVKGLFDIYFSPIIAGYHFSKTEHASLSFNVWAPTGKYDPSKVANVSLNNWTFIPQVAYTNILAADGVTIDVLAGVQFYTKNKATDYENAPLFTMDAMVRKAFGAWSLGLIVGTTQQMGRDKGPTADRLNGFRGNDWAVGPIVTYDTKLHGKDPLSFTLRWVPTVSSKNRIDSENTVMVTGTLVF